MARSFSLLVALLALPTLAPAGAFHTRLRRPAHGVQVRLTPVTVPPASEREVCQLVTLRNRRAMDVNEISIAMPSGATYTSHHFAIFLYQSETTAGIPTGPFDNVGCSGVGTTFVSPILAFVQRPRQRLRFPGRVGVTLRPKERLLLNSHYLNAGSEPVTYDAAVNFRAVPRGFVQHHARSFQLGTVDIDIPPGEEGSAGAKWLTPFPMNVVWLSTHSHKHTEAVDLDVVRGGEDAGEVLRTVSYGEPTVNLYPQPLRLEAGDGFRWTCHYRNGTPARLTFGVTSNDEMCFTVGFFYPDDDAAPLPRVPRCFGGGEGLVCPLN